MEEPYKVDSKVTDIMLEVLNLDKKETVSIDTISNQDLSEVTFYLLSFFFLFLKTVII